MSEKIRKVIKKTGFWCVQKKGKGEKIPSSWIAKILGYEANEKGYSRLAREFLRENALQWLGKKSEGWPRGMKTWELGDGLYELCLFPSERHAVEIGEEEGAERFFASVKDGVLTKLSREELDKLLPESVTPPHDDPIPFDASTTAEEGD